MFNRSKIWNSEVSLPPYFHQDVLHEKDYKIRVTVVESLSCSLLRNLLYFFLLELVENFRRYEEHLCFRSNLQYWSLIKKIFLKIKLSPFKKVAFICFDKKPFKNDGKCFLFHVKSCPDFFGHVKNGLTRKLMLISKSMTSQIGMQIITIVTFPNFSIVKTNQMVKFVQVTGYNMKNIFLEKS